MKKSQSPLFEFEELYAEYGPMLYRFCLRLTGNRTEAEDLTQDVFVVALRDPSRFRGQSSVRTWLYQIAIYQARSWRHKRRRERSLRVEDHQKFATMDIQISLEQAINNLPEKLRQAFLLVKLEQFTASEAALVLGIPEGTVKYHVHQAICQLRSTLTEEGTPEENTAPITGFPEQGVNHAL